MTILCYQVGGLVEDFVGVLFGLYCSLDNPLRRRMSSKVFRCFLQIYLRNICP